MARLEARITALEVQHGLTDRYMKGIIEVPNGVRPLDCLRDATPGYWLLVDAYDRMPGLLGHVSLDGKRVIYTGAA